MSVVQYRIEWIHPKDGELKKEGLTRSEALAVFKELKEKYAKDEKAMEVLNSQNHNFGFGGMSGFGYNLSIDSGYPLEKTDERHFCPRRAESPNPMAFIGEGDDPEKPDRWDKLNGERICSYCGSIHPADFIELVKKEGKQIIEPSTKMYKIYIRRMDVPNAGYGAIKYYRQHDVQYAGNFVEEMNALILKKE